MSQVRTAKFVDIEELFPQTEKEDASRVIEAQLMNSTARRADLSTMGSSLSVVIRALTFRVVDSIHKENLRMKVLTFAAEKIQSCNQD